VTITRGIEFVCSEFRVASRQGQFEALTARYPEFTANEFYAEVSRLSRTGKVTITRGVGVFSIKRVEEKVTGVPS